ncbi:MAG: serine hydrolase domain-containing protein [Longimicrobiaceae bacterium]
MSAGRALACRTLAAAGAAVLALLARPCGAPAQSPPPLAGLEIADSLAAAEFAKDSVGSLTVGVVDRGALVWTRSFGWADMEARRPAGRGTVYRVGSVTKPFTAVMLLQLAEAGRVRLADPVERWYPEIRTVPGLAPGAAPPTLLQLATMTSGLAAEPAQPGPFWSGPVAGWETVLAAALPRARYESAPGTAFSYSNVGYAVLGAALGRAAGQPYTRWQRERILEPLGMRRSGFEPDPGMLRDLARGYVVERDGTRDSLTSVAELRDGRGYKVPTGGLFTTVDDLARFVAFELGHGPAAVLPPARLDSAFGGVVASSRGLRSGYGLGFMVRRRGDFTWVGHEGGVAGYMAAMYFDRRSGIGVVALQSAIGGEADAIELASVLLERLVAARPAAVPAR